MKRHVASSGERGITLLETIVVLAMASVLLAAAVGSMRGFVAQKTLSGWSDSIANDLRGAQQLAIARRTPVVVTFTNSVPPSYATTIGGDTVRSQTLQSELAFTTATVQFNTLGVPASAVSLTLTDTRNGQTLTISVAAGTGAVTVQ